MSAQEPGPVQPGEEAEILVVGAGVLGTAIADELAGRGRDVVLLDRVAPGHPASASGDTTRILRSGYGANERYAARAWDAHRRWAALGARTGTELVIPTGVVWLATGDGAFEEETLATLERLSVPVERLDAAGVGALYPSIEVADVRFGVWEPEAGVLRARHAVQTLAISASARGARIRRGTARPTDDGVEIDGSPFSASRVIWASGAWLPGLFPGVVNTVVTAQDAVYVRATGEAWEVDRVPAWIDPTGTRYGMGAENELFKVASSALGPVFDPWGNRPGTDRETLESALGYAARRFPSLGASEAAHVHPCQYSSSADTQFIVAPHPSRPEWLLVGGDSGHAFKHALGIAEHVGALLDGAAPDPEWGLGERDGSRGLRVSSQ